MFLAYVDESGDSGSLATRGSQTYSLGCLLVDDQHWMNVFDSLIAFRRRLRVRYNIPMGAELKANFLIRGSGPLTPLGLSQNDRYVIYRAHLRVLSTLPVQVFSIVMDKRSITLVDRELRLLAWETLLQRLERSTRTGASLGLSRTMLLHDQGDDDLVRAIARRSRRWLTAGSAFGSGARRSPFDRLLDDPSPRVSHQSYFIQCSDLAAYAAFRTVIPPGSHAQPICPATMWQELGAATLTSVNRVAGGTPGVVVRK